MSTRTRAGIFLSAIGLALASATPAWAHPGHLGHSVADGWAHPLTGIDHLLAMVAVGLLAVRMGGRAVWMMPLCFMGAMLAGGLLAYVGIGTGQSTIIEYGISASVLLLGLMIAFSAVVPLRYGAAIVALFAILHGHAHVTELAAGGSIVGYAVGFLAATALLHASGVCGGLTLARFVDKRAVRLAGGVISLAGLLLLCGVLHG